jgi:hypothetical protein
MTTSTERVRMHRMPVTEMPGLTTSHFSETVRADNLPMPFRAHMERVLKRAEADNGLFQDLGAMALIASIGHWSERAREVPEIAAELETLAEQVSKLGLPRNGRKLQLLVRQLKALDYVPVRDATLTPCAIRPRLFA